MGKEYSDEAVDDTIGPVPIYAAPSFSWASVDGIIEWEELVKRDYAIPGSQAEILDVEIIPAGAEPLGQVKGGPLKLRGLAISYDELISHDDSIEVFTIFDDPQLKMDRLEADWKTKHRIFEILYFRLQEMRVPTSGAVVINGIPA
jgi:hypothetical protein